MLSPPASIAVLALVLPGLASGAAVYVPPECGALQRDAPEVDDCGATPGEPFHAPDGECIDLRTSLVYSCANPRVALGAGVPAWYAYAQARSAMTDRDCGAMHHVDNPVQWCVRFVVAVASMKDGPAAVPRLRVDASIDDACYLLKPRVFSFNKDYDGPAIWTHVQNGPSKCGHAFGAIVANVTISDADTGRVLHASQSQAYYGPTGVFWVGPGSDPCSPPPFPWMGDRYDCKLFHQTPGGEA